MMEKFLTVQVTSNGHRDVATPEVGISRTIDNLKRKIELFSSAFSWICVTDNKELIVLTLHETQHSVSVLRYEEHEVIGDD